jgi:hypothetical protein
MELYLVISGEVVHKTEEFMSNCGVDESVDTWEGKLSLRHVFFRSVKSTHILHLPLGFLTITTFANHSGNGLLG